MLIRMIAFVCVAAVLAIVVSRTSWLLAYASPDAIRSALAHAAGDPLLPLYVVVAFLAAGAVLVSPWLVIAQVALIVPAAVAVPLALTGALASATAFSGIGRALGASVAHRIVPRRVQAAIDGAGLGTVVAVRAVPALPYTLVNLCAGAFRVPFGTYALGTALGMTPGIVAIALLGERFVAAITHPSPSSVGLLALVLGAVGGSIVVVKRRHARSSRERPELERRA